MAKLFVSEAAGRCADRAVQAFGGRGYMRSQRRRALQPRAARRSHLGGDERDPAPDHRPRPRAARRRADDPVVDLTRLLAPAQIAVVGATERHGSYGAQTLLNLDALGFPGPVWGVNPRYERGARPALRRIARRPAGAGRRGRDRDPRRRASRRSSSRRARSGAAAPSCYGAGFAEVAERARASRRRWSRPRAGTRCRCAGPTATGSSRWRRGPRCGATRCRCARPATSRSSRRAATSPSTRSPRCAACASTPSCPRATRRCCAPSDYLAALAADEDVHSIALYLEDDGDGAALCDALAACADARHAGRRAQGRRVGGGRGAPRPRTRARSRATSASSARWSRRRARSGREDVHDLLELAKTLAVTPRLAPQRRGSRS